jgi:3,4-dihydroxy 2-butanone 4-phosphate synthase/GTP cyclohydrolase II
VLVLLARPESEEALLHSIDLALGEDRPSPPAPTDTYNTIGLGSQILRDLGVGQIHLLGAPMKYNAISGFGLEVLETIRPAASQSGEPR